MSRVLFVQFLHSINMYMSLFIGLGLIFASDSLFPEINAAGKPIARMCGAFALVYGLLIQTLGPTHHGGYCLTMVLNFILMAVNSLSAQSQKLADGSVDLKYAVPAGINGALFAIMLGILINGGIGHHAPKAEKKKDH